MNHCSSCARWKCSRAAALFGAGLFVAALVPLAAKSSDELQYQVTFDPGIAFRTRPGALLCPSYFAIKEAKAAVTAHDRAWLERTGCIEAKDSLEIVLIDAPWRYREYGVIWRGRIYPRPGEGGDAADAYFSEDDALTFATAGRFADGAAAERQFARLVKLRNLYANWPPPLHRIIPDAGQFDLILGPGSYKTLYLFCSEAAANGLESHEGITHARTCNTIGRLPD